MSSAMCNVVSCIFVVMLTFPPQSTESVEISSCGQSPANFRARIINGEVSPRGWWPWQIAIYKVHSFHCGGALISPRWVLTAAHCFYHGRYLMSNKDLYQIKAGDHNLSVNETSQQEIPLQRIFVHPRFKQKGAPYFDGDLALVKLNQEVKLGGFVRSVCLPEKSEGDLAVPNKRGTVAGWGVTRPLKIGERGSLNDVSKVLRHATFPIKSDQLCINKSGILFNSTTAFCAGDGKGKSDSCQGDSGGAFVRKARNSKWVVIGIVSWGNGCAQKDQYGYYTRIHPFLDWIKETMETEDSFTCAQPALPRGSTIIHPHKQEKYKKGSTVLFGCKQGFYLVGKPIMKCLGRTWTQRKFRCVGFCPDLLQISNGRVIDTSLSNYQASVEFRCNDNFRLVGRSRLECIDGRWNGELPFCETTLCSKPAIPSNSYIIYPPTTQVSYTDGTHVFLACRDGYYLQGSPIMVCNQTAWIKREFRCIASCPVIASIKNGIITHATLREGGEVEIKCLPNYTLVGPSRLRCIEGKWNNSLPSCKAVDCGLLDKPDHGDIIEQVGLTFGNRIVFECKDKGYELSGSRIRTCQSDGTWSGSLTTCDIVQCGDPGKPANGAQKVNKGFVYGGSVEFICDNDYTLSGTPTIYCQENKEWAGSVPQCLAPCPDPGRPHQGNRFGDDFRHGKSVTFTCPKDYRMEGVRTTTCSDGRWSNTKPSCKAPCTKLTPPPHGTTLGDDFTHGASVMFYCRHGYTRVGTSPIRCNDGNWNKPLPVCKGFCKQPRTPYKVRLLGNKARYLDGEEATFHCDSNYDLFGNDRIRCVGKNWDSSVPVCKARCSFSRIPRGGLYFEGRSEKSGMIKHGENLTYGCLPAYTMIGPKTRECDNGRWTNDAPVCKAPCSNPGTPANGSMQGDDLRHDSRMIFTCDQNYQLDGDKIIHCKDGSWSGSVPNCVVVCPDPGVPSNGKRLDNKFQEGETVTFKCNRDYDLMGNDTIRCEGGVWSGEIPKCRARCSFDGSPDNGYTTEGNYRMQELLPDGSSVKYACYEPYTLVGSDVRQCDDGSWNTSLPSCKAPCDYLGLLAEGRKIGNDYSHGQIVRYECTMKGYSLVGNPTLTCNDGSWDSEKPECKASCSDPGIPNNGTKDGDDYRSRANVTFRCNPPFELIGSRVIFCQDGKWSGSRPTCSNCARPLGLEENKNRIRSPSSLIDSRYPPNAARLNGPSAWCPSRTPAYLQIDLDKSYKITAIATQGGTARNKWVQTYTISFKAGEKIIYYTESGSRKDIPGNKDASSLVQYKFKEPFITSAVRIHPSSAPNDAICLRVELYGCNPDPDCILVGSMFWGLWKYNLGANSYYKAYITKLNATHLDFALRFDNRLTRSYRRNDSVLILDTVPQMKNISINSSVIARQHSRLPDRYRSGIVVGFPSASFVSVKFDNGEILSVHLRYLRLVSRPGFCVNDV